MAKPLFVLIAAASCSSAASAATYTISSSASLSSGRYGGTQETRVAASSIGLRTQLGSWDLQATLPYLSIEDPSSSALSVGGALVAREATTRRRQRGYGDVTFRLSRDLPLGDNFPVQARLAAFAKLPTGARSFSTGKVDGGVAVEVSRSVGPVVPFASAGYRMFGDTELVRLRDGWTTSAGIMLAVGKISLVASHESAQSIAGGAGSREFFAAASGPLTRDWGWSLYGTKGYSAGAANLMVGTAITRTFGAR